MLRLIFSALLSFAAIVGIFLIGAAYERAEPSELIVAQTACASLREIGISMDPDASPNACRLNAFSRSIEHGQRIQLEQGAYVVTIPQAQVLVIRPSGYDAPLSSARIWNRNFGGVLLASAVIALLIIGIHFRQEQKK